MDLVQIRSDSRMLKKTIAQIYNRIHQDFYVTGVGSQKIRILEDRIMIFAQQKRVAAFSVLSKNYKELTIHADAALIAEFKSRLKKEVEAETGIPVKCVLKDYDTETEYACCVIIFETGQDK